MIDDPANALHVARAHVRVTEIDRHRTDLLQVISDSYDQLRNLDDTRAAELAHADQLLAGYRDQARAVR